MSGRKTLQARDRRGRLPARRTAIGRRYWLKRDLDEYPGRASAGGPQRGVAYGRVSSQAQRPELNNQRRIVEEFCLAKGIANVEFLEEIGGDLNFQSAKFLALVDSIVSRKSRCRSSLSRIVWPDLVSICGSSYVSNMRSQPTRRKRNFIVRSQSRTRKVADKYAC